MNSRLFSRKQIQQQTGPVLLTVLMLILPTITYAAGSWQFGLSEGVSHEQPLFEYDNSYSNASANGIESYPRPLYVDLLSDSEVVNISLCGYLNSDDIRIEIWDENGTTQLHSSGTLPSSNVACNNDFTGPLSNPYQFSPGAAGTYQLRFFNDSRNRKKGVFRRFDVTVTPDSTTPADPTLDQGRLWSYRWAFYCAAGTACFDADHSTSADLYAVVDGGFADSYYVWQLDLDHLTGWVYEIVANSTGIDSPNDDGNVVAGLSACIDTDDDPSDGCDAVSGNRNNITPLHKIYTGFPALSYTRPTTVPEITDFRFLDDAGVDDSISPSGTPSVQDTGDFLFSTNLATTGNYQIIIDITDDGIYGRGDVILNGLATPGANSVRWDGLDNSGNVVPDGSYGASIVLKTGEFHFTAADVETSGGPGNQGLTINGVQDDGTIDSSNTVYWDDSTILQSGRADAYNGDGAYRYHNWGEFSGGGEGNLAYIDTYTVGYSSSPVLTHLAVEPVDMPPRIKVIGSVYHDLNGNGTRDPGEPGFPNITVTLTDDQGNVQQVSTDSNGNYEAYTTPLATSVTVDVDQSMLPSEFVQTGGTDPNAFSPLVPGVENNVGDDGYQQQIASSIGDTIWHDLNQNGVLDAGEPGIDGVTVDLIPDANGNGIVDGSEAASATEITAGGGLFYFTGLAPGDYIVQVSDTAGVLAAFIQTGGTDPHAVTDLAAGQDYNDADFGYAQGNPAISLTKTATTESYSAAGSVLSYTFTIMNSGNVPLSNVMVVDPAATVSGGPITSLAPGASDSTTFTAIYTVSQADVDAGSFNNTATVTGSTLFGSTVTDSDSATVPVVADNGPIIDPEKKFNWPLFLPAILPPPCPDEPLYCYIVADRDNETETSEEGSTNSALLKYTFTENNLELVGRLGVGSVEAMTLTLDGTTLYAVDSDVFGYIDTESGNTSSFVPINPNGLGAGDGVLGLVEFTDIDGISFDPSTGTLYGTNRRAGSDLLLQINPATGTFAKDAFGPGIDYVMIAGNAEGAAWYDLDDIGIDKNGTMYGIVNASGLDDRLVVIDKTTGDISDPVQLPVEDMALNDVEGFSYFDKDTFYGTTGVETTGGEGAYKNSLFKIETNPVRVEHIIDLDQDFNGYRPYDFEAVACRVCTQGRSTR